MNAQIVRYSLGSNVYVGTNLYRVKAYLKIGGKWMIQLLPTARGGSPINVPLRTLENW